MLTTLPGLLGLSWEAEGCLGTLEGMEVWPAEPLSCEGSGLCSRHGDGGGGVLSGPRGSLAGGCGGSRAVAGSPGLSCLRNKRRGARGAHV